MVSLNQMGGMALALVLAAIVISVGSSILFELADDRCDDSGGTYSQYSWNQSWGCCTSVTNTTWCNAAYDESTAFNVSESGMESMETFADWLPLIALVVVAAIVIGIIVTYMGGSR